MKEAVSRGWQVRGHSLQNAAAAWRASCPCGSPSDNCIGSVCCFCCLSAWLAFRAQWFLANKHSNYRKSKARGKAAHTAAVELSNLVADTGGAEGLIDLGRAPAQVGMGRDLYFVLTKAE